MPEKERHFIVKGVDENLRGFGGFQYPERGIIEAPDWNDEKVWYGGIFGIDWDSSIYDIRNDMYLIIEYNLVDGFVRLYTEKLKIRKGIVVYSSSDIKKIQDWLEAHGDRYRGYGASIQVGDNEKVIVGNCGTIISGDNCKIAAGNSCTIIAGNNCKVKVRYDCNIKTGDTCKVIGGYNSTISVGKKSIVSARHGASISGGEGTYLVWRGTPWYDYEMLITEKESGKKYVGVIYDNEWEVNQVEE